jgi:Asp-tRNA(Asn)/Glu-tRNA(Gln) amidotransferase B subunit
MSENTTDNVELRHRINDCRQLIPEAKTDPASKQALLNYLGEFLRNNESVPDILSRWYCDEVLPELNEKQCVSVADLKSVGMPKSPINWDDLDLLLKHMERGASLDKAARTLEKEFNGKRGYSKKAIKTRYTSALERVLADQDLWNLWGEPVDTEEGKLLLMRTCVDAMQTLLNKKQKK